MAQTFSKSIFRANVMIALYKIAEQAPNEPITFKALQEALNVSTEELLTALNVLEKNNYLKVDTGIIKDIRLI